jgi:hypothetical protein
MDRPGHQPDHLGGRGVAAGQVRRDRAAVLEHRDPVADLADLLEPVRDVDDGDAVRGELADHPEQVLHLLGSSTADGSSITMSARRGTAPGHAHHLLAGRGQRAHLAAGRISGGRAGAAAPRPLSASRRRGEAERRGSCPRTMFSATLSPAPGRAPGRSWRCRPVGGLRGAERDRLARQRDLARVRPVRAGQHLDQRRLAGAVLAEQAVHLAGRTSRSTPSSARTPGNCLTIPRIVSSGRHCGVNVGAVDQCRTTTE